MSKSDGLTGPSALETCITDYLDEKRAAGSFRETLALSTHVLQEVLLPFCRQSDITEPGQLTPGELSAFRSGLVDGTGSRSGRPLSTPSVASNARTINLFLEWVTKRGAAGASRAEMPRLPGPEVEVLSRDDIRALEDAAPSERDKLIIRLLADTGVRLGGLVTAGSVLHQRGRTSYLEVRGKDDRERMVPIPPGLAARIERYGRQTRRGSSSGALFLGDRRSSKTGEYEPLTASETAQLTRDLGQDALQRRVHPHLLRRSFASKQRHSRDGQ